MQTIYWLAIFVILLIIEIVTMGLTTIWFAGGALAAMAAGLIGFGTGIQILVFLVVSVLLLVLTRPIEPNGKIAKNKVVVIEGIQGVKLIVREKEERHE